MAHKVLCHLECSSIDFLFFNISEIPMSFLNDFVRWIVLGDVPHSNTE